MTPNYYEQLIRLMKWLGVIYACAIILSFVVIAMYCWVGFIVQPPQLSANSVAHFGQPTTSLGWLMLAAFIALQYAGLVFAYGAAILVAVFAIALSVQAWRARSLSKMPVAAIAVELQQPNSTFERDAPQAARPSP
jgi:hypothetical protein